MYRDGAIDLDEHDRAVGLILIGETLLGQCEAATAKIQGGFDPERWRTLRDLHYDYEQVWVQLDRAKKVLSTRGANTTRYEEIRAEIAPTLVATKFGKKGHALHEVRGDALDDARRAIAELKLAVPGADWSAIAARTDKLVEHERREIRRPWLPYAAAAVAAFALGVVAWSRVVTPGKPVDDRALMRAEIQSVAAQRDIRIELMEPIALHPQMCDVASAAQFTKMLRMDGRKDEARAYGTSWLGRCGLHDEVMKWTTGRSIFVPDPVEKKTLSARR